MKIHRPTYVPGTRVGFDSHQREHTYGDDTNLRSRNQASQSTQHRRDKDVFYFISISQLRRPIELKFSQNYYVMDMLRYTK